MCFILTARLCLQTYKEAVFKPSPRLNLILAPNGDLTLLISFVNPWGDIIHAKMTFIYANECLDGPLLDRGHLMFAGAGKSSLTCALCLGLAGDPKVSTSACSLTLGTNEPPPWIAV